MAKEKTCLYEGHYNTISDICGPAKENGYILLAIASENVRKIIRNLLIKSDILVYDTGDFRKAMAVIKDPSLVSRHLKVNIRGCLCAILEEKPGEFSGINLLQEIRADKDMESLIVIIISEESEFGDVGFASEAGANGYITIAEGIVPRTIEKKLLKAVNDRADPPQYVKLLQAGEAFLEQIEDAKALQCFNGALESYQKMSLGKISHLADEELKKVLPGVGDRRANAERTVQRARECLEKKEHEKAIEKFEQALDYLGLVVKLKEFRSNKSSSLSRIFMHIGKVHEQRGDIKEAENFYRQAAEINPVSLKACLEMIRVCEKNGDKDGVVKYLRQVNNINPHNGERQQKFGELCLGTGDFEEARSAFDQAIHDDPVTIRKISRMCLNAENTTLASYFLDKAVRISRQLGSDTDFVQDVVDQYNELGRQLRMEEKHSQAIEEYDRALNVAPEDARLTFNKGRAFFEWGKTDKGKTLESKQWLIRAAKIYLKKGERDEELEKGLDTYLEKFGSSLIKMRGK